MYYYRSKHSKRAHITAADVALGLGMFMVFWFAVYGWLMCWF